MRFFETEIDNNLKRSVLFKFRSAIDEHISNKQLNFNLFRGKMPIEAVYSKLPEPSKYTRGFKRGLDSHPKLDLNLAKMLKQEQDIESRQETFRKNKLSQFAKKIRMKLKFDLKMKTMIALLDNKRIMQKRWDNRKEFDRKADMFSSDQEEF